MSATEAWRRIRQLQAERYTNTELAHAIGWNCRNLPAHTAKMTLRMVLKIKRAYRLRLVDPSIESPK